MFAHQYSNSSPHVGTASVQNAPARQLINRIEARLGDLASQQEEVAESREQLLVGRGQLARSRMRVQEQRDRTGNAEVSLMNILRQHYNDLGSAFPPEIDAAYAKVDEERTKLGSLEAEHIELDRTLGAREWTHMDLENNFYQFDVQQILADRLVDNIEPTRCLSNRDDSTTANPIPPSAAVQYQVETTEYERLQKWFRDLRKAIARLFESSTLDIDAADLIDIEITDAVRSFDHVLTHLIECEVKIQHIKQVRMVTDDCQPIRGRRASEPVMYKGSQSIASSSISKAVTEGAVSSHIDQVPVIHRIRDWLLDCLKQNALNKMQYLSILQQEMSVGNDEDNDLSEWEILIVQQWPFDMMTTEPVKQMGAPATSSSRPQAQLRVDSDHEDFLFDQEHIVVSHTPQLQSREPQDDKHLLEDLILDVPTYASDLALSNNDAFLLRNSDQDSDASTIQRSPWKTGSEVGQASTCSSIHSEITPLVADRLDSFMSAERWNSLPCTNAEKDSRIISPCLPAVPGSEVSAQGPSIGSGPAKVSASDVETLPASMNPELDYTTWEWSSDLRLYYILGFTKDGDISEAQWSEIAFSYSAGKSKALASQDSSFESGR